MLRVTSKIRAPYGGTFWVRDPITQKEYEGGTFENLFNRVCAGRAANGIPMGLDFEDEVESWVCANQPSECSQALPGQFKLKSSIGLWDVVRGTASLLNHKAQGSPLVSQDEANRRAAICSKCPANVQMTLPCHRCMSSLENVAHYVSNAGSTPYDDQMRSCGICGCWTKTAVWVELGVQCVAVTQSMRDQFKVTRSLWNCWKNCD